MGNSDGSDQSDRSDWSENQQQVGTEHPLQGGAGGYFLNVKNFLTFTLPRVAQICARLPSLACKKPLTRHYNKATGERNKAAS